MQRTLTIRRPKGADMAEEALFGGDEKRTTPGIRDSTRAFSASGWFHG